MARILITGGSGFIGSNLAVSLAGQGHELVCFDNFSRNGARVLARRLEAAAIPVIEGDIRNPEDLEQLPGIFDLMIECSAEPSVLVGTEGDDARFMLENNLVGSLNCFEYARKQGSAVIFLSTSRVYPYDKICEADYGIEKERFVLESNERGLSNEGLSENYGLKGAKSLYGATKLASEVILEEYCHQYGMKAIINRCGVVAGPWQLGKVDQGVFAFWLANHYFKRPLRYIGFGGRGLQVRDLLHIDDLADLVSLQIKDIHNYAGEIFNVGGGLSSSLSLCETTALCQKITGNDLGIVGDDSSRTVDIPWYVTDNTKVTEAFSWSPQRNGHDVLNDFHQWLVEHEAEFKEVFDG